MDVSQYKELFVSEATEHLEALNQSLLELEKDPENLDLLTEIFRSAHTLKGMSATLGFDQLTELSHEMENVLDGLRGGDLLVTSEVLDLLFGALDALGALVKAIAEDSAVPVDTRPILSELRAVVEGQPLAPRPAPMPEEGRAAERKPAKKPRRAKKPRKEEEEAAPQEREEALPREEPAAAAAEEAPVESEAREEEAPPEGAAEIGEAGAAAPSGTPAAPLALEREELKELAREAKEGALPYLLRITLDEDCVLKSVRVFMVFKRISQASRIVKSVPPVEDLEDEKFDTSFEVLVATREDQQQLRKSILAIAEVEGVEIIPLEVPVAEEVAEEAGRPAEEEEKQQWEPRERGEAKPAQAAALPIRTQSVRVNISRLDNLMNLVGELVINRTRLMEIASTYNIAELKETLDHTARLTADLQDEVMKTRMVPVEHVFNRFPRMVRDLAKSQGKDVDFNIEGKEIELDRTILDEISDPLMHLLRNAVDHGIDYPEERERLGKPRRGIITLLARRDRNYVSIEVSDDGQGVDHERIFELAVQRGLASPEEKRAFTDDEILRFLASPGFSSASEVSGVSGRGVGLDVVKSKVESLGGMLVMTSQKGRGTTFAMKLPLTLAIIQALLVEAGGEIYAIPLGTVRETAVVDEHEIRQVQHQEVIFLREETVPLLRLHRLLGIPQENGKGSFPVVVVEIAVRSLAIAVDELLGQQEIVITSLDRFLKGIKGFAGATILGSGRVALILDIPSLL